MNATTPCITWISRRVSYARSHPTPYGTARKAQAVSRRPYLRPVHVLFVVNKLPLGKSFLLCNSGFPRHCHTINAPTSVTHLLSTLYNLSNLLTYLLTPYSRVLEKLTGSQPVKKFPAFYGTRRFIAAFSSARHLSLSWASSIQSTPPRPTSWRFILILPSNLCLGLPSGLFPSGNPTKTLYTPLLSPIRATCHAYLIHLDLITRTILGEEYRPLSSSLCSFLHSLVTSSLLDPNILLNTLFSSTFSPRSSLNVSDHVLHPYTPGKITVLYILIFKILATDGVVKQTITEETNKWWIEDREARKKEQNALHCPAQRQLFSCQLHRMDEAILWRLTAFPLYGDSGCCPDRAEF